MTTRPRVALLALACLLLAAGAGGVLWRAADRAAAKDRPRAGGPVLTEGRVTLDRPTEPGGLIVLRNMAWGPHRDELATVHADDPTGPRTVSGVKCLRFHAAAGTGVCLRAVPGALTESYEAVVLDSRLRPRATKPLAGIPTRARVAPDGRRVAWTVFVGGDSYAGTNFSTRTSILDLDTGRYDASLEEYAIVKDGAPYRAADVNFWGVTFAADGRTFYATLATGGRTHLVRGDLAARTVTTLRENVECPSLSPDGHRIAFKKRVPGLPAEAPWRLYVLDLRSGAETALAETRSVDDQAVWVDPDTLEYSLPGDSGADLLTVPADGTGSPRVLTRAALAPAWLR
ncbi:TolB family protein (plasmid) [Streptomyces sp. BI20]|uniref:TolB family protein n=1 Tax=Streptomyces sp. BI20 TaxID=3403460 RepID=UPI003C72E58F